MKKIIFPLISLLSYTLGQAQLQPSGDIVLPGTNSWLFHTPDDGRTTLYIAPKINNNWDWNKQFEFKNTGELYAPKISTPKFDLYGADLVLGIADGRSIGNKPRQRALVHYENDELIINFEGDFEGGTTIAGGKTVVQGNLGVGTWNPDEKLTVNGNIHAREVKVDLKIPADYVFQQYYTGTSSLKEEYRFPTLQETERFIKENHHLPQVPSARQIQEQGLKVGEMTNLLLQKIEELTLYSIEQNKALQEQEKQLNAYNEKNKALEMQVKIQQSELNQLKQSIKNLLPASPQP